jgi:hypothetical protein
MSPWAFRRSKILRPPVGLTVKVKWHTPHLSLDISLFNDRKICINRWDFSVWSNFIDEACLTGAEDWLWKPVIGLGRRRNACLDLRARDRFFWKFAEGLSDARLDFVESQKCAVATLWFAWRRRRFGLCLLRLFVKIRCLRHLRAWTPWGCALWGFIPVPLASVDYVSPDEGIAGIPCTARMPCNVPCKDEYRFSWHRVGKKYPIYVCNISLLHTYIILV